ncbi:actin cytoskeleton and mitosis protein [Sporothrix epigloea]|uniref:Actin cytoskeleton and mitosis protein n=1 Tax=Sporothrix epigloea TaxID=1892477 RepID=A0ABP0D9G0_9PEZI
MSGPSANGSASATPPSNPFGAAPVNPFKAALAVTAASVPSNPFQATGKPAVSSPFAAALSQPATLSTTTSPFGAPITQQSAPSFSAQPLQPALSSAFQTSQPASTSPASNPFASLQQAATASTSLFGNAPALGAANGTPSIPQSKPVTAAFGQQSAASGTLTPLAQTGTSAPANPFLSSAKPSPAPTPILASSSTSAPFTTTFSASPSTAVGAASAVNFGAPATKHVAKRSSHFNTELVAPQRQAQGVAVPTPSNGFGAGNLGLTTMVNAPANNSKESPTDYAKKIIAQLQKDKLRPPKWPTDPGNPANASAIEAFWNTYGTYRDDVRKSLVKAGLIDDPKVRKRLDQAIDFKGICEEMCPEYEKIERIFQHNVMMAEKAESPDGTMWPSTPLMVKALTRSSAGQEAPLPMDVRTVAALKRTLDHLIDNVLSDDSRLPSVHNFLWDRTRAIRRDFIFHSNMSKEEMLQQIYCFETITRFHATSLHLLSQKGFAPEGFDQRQEREQLSKALLSLLQAYDDCKDRHIECVNECEFRAYFILLNAHDPNFQHKVAEWGMKLWYESDDVQTAMTLAQAMQSVWDWRGPIKPTAPTTTALGAFGTFFRIVASPQVSYTMACLAEMHFVHVRRGILRNMTRAYARARDSPKDLTIAALNSMLRFDTIDEAWEFVSANKLEFSSEDKATAYLVLDKSVQVSSMPIPQLFSHNLVERKRAGRSLPEALHSTVYEDAKYASPAQTSSTSQIKQSSDLFVDQSPSSRTPYPNANQGKVPTPFVPPAFQSTGSSTAQPATSATSLFATTPPSSTPFSSVPAMIGQKATSSSTTPAAPFGIFFQPSSNVAKTDDTPSLFQTTPITIASQSSAPSFSPASLFANPSSTTPASSPSKPGEPSNPIGNGASKAPSIFTAKSSLTSTEAPTASIFSQQSPTKTNLSSKPVEPAFTQPPADTSFLSLFPTPTAFNQDSKTSAPSASAASSLFSAAPVKTAEAGQTELGNKPAFLTENAPKPSPAASPFMPAAPSAATSLLKPNLPPKSPSPPPPHQITKKDLLNDFTQWYVKGDNGILSEFQDAIVEHLVRQTFEQFKHDEEERIQREEDERSWAEALRFKTYNLRIKFFYKWRRIARERALDRRARQARDELKAYRTAKRAEQRAAAEKAAAEERVREAEARRMVSKEVEFLKGLGYYDGFGASTRKRKVTVAGEDAGAEEQQRSRSVSTSIVGHQQSYDDKTTSQEVTQLPAERRRSSGVPVRSIRDGIISTVSRAKELFTSRMTTNGVSSNKSNHRGSIGSAASLEDAGSISGDSIYSVQSMRSSFSPDGSQVAYYRRSIPGKNRAHSFFTRVPSGTAPTATAGGDGLTPAKKVTNFMRYSKKASQFGLGGNGSSVSGSFGSSLGLPGARQQPATATASPSPSSLASFPASIAGSGVGARTGDVGGSKVRSSYWRLRAMGMVQMPNKQYLHESLALPMLQDGKRFPGVGNYGLPPVPAWNDGGTSDTKQIKGANELLDDFSINKDGGQLIDSDGEENEQVRAQRYTEETLRRTAMPPSRKRLFSDGNDAQNGAIGATTSYARASRVAAASTGATAAPFDSTALTESITSPPGAKKLRVLASPSARDTSALSEAERVIREMREMADAMDQGRDWFKEQTDLMKSGATAWDE